MPMSSYELLAHLLLFCSCFPPNFIVAATNTAASGNAEVAAAETQITPSPTIFPTAPSSV
jgi:hypothetical protein